MTSLLIEGIQRKAAMNEVKTFLDYEVLGAGVSGDLG